MTLLDACRENLKKAREKLVSHAKNKAARVDVDLERVCDLRQACREPKSKEELRKYRNALAFLEERCTNRWKDFCRQVDILREIEKKGWS